MKLLRGCVFLFILAALIGCGEVKHAYQEPPVTKDPSQLPKPTGTNGDGSLIYADGFNVGPTCVLEGEVKHGSGGGYILRSLSDVWARALTGRGVKWSNAEQKYFLAKPERMLPGDFAVFETQDTHTISWEIEWHYRISEGNENAPELVTIGYTMIHATTVPFITPIVSWSGSISLRNIAKGVTGFHMDNYINGRASCEDSRGAVVDIFNNLHL